MNTRKYWLDQLRILTWLTVDPASPIAIGVIPAMWWVPAWFLLSLAAAMLGPHRGYRLKTSALAPIVNSVARVGSSRHVPVASP